jgi:hypothetical protein
MTVEALWTIEFETASRWTNGGVVVLQRDRLFGGDSSYYFTGTYRVSGQSVTADLHATHYHGQLLSAYGDPAREIDVKIEAEMAKDARSISGQALRLGYPAINLRMKRRVDIR